MENLRRSSDNMRILIVPMAALAENAAALGKKLSDAGGINTLVRNI